MPAPSTNTGDSSKVAFARRLLGRTGLEVSLLGVGGGYVSVADLDYGTELYRRALARGINYFDGRYGNSNQMLRPVMKDPDTRAGCVLTTKTANPSAEGAYARILEDLRELGTDYLDIFYLRTYNQDMLRAHFAPGGSLEGVKRARAEGLIRNIGLAGHSDMGALADGVATDEIDVVMFPLNVVRRDAVERLIPAAQEHDVGLVAMKPLNAGTLAPEVALPWLAEQPIHLMIPGMATLKDLDADIAALDKANDPVRVERVRADQDHLTCRVCKELCSAACPQVLPLDVLLYHDVNQNLYRALGLEGLLAHPLAGWAKRGIAHGFEARLAHLVRCDGCGACEEVCPHHLPIRRMLQDMIEPHQALLDAVRVHGWDTDYEGAPSPFH